LPGTNESVFKKDFTKPQATEIWEPKPKIVTPGIGAAPPSDAIVLFDGKNMDNWVMSKDKSPSKWVLDKGVMTVKIGEGNLQTKQKFGDCQLHVEFKIPADAKNSPDPTMPETVACFYRSDTKYRFLIPTTMKRPCMPMGKWEAFTSR
jgi:hypothetical protein